MNSDISEGNWKQAKGQLREQWGDLTDDELEQARGRREDLVGKIQEKYGETKEDIEKAVDKVMQKFS